MPLPDRTLSVAPMLDWTDRFERYFLRLISRHVLLYTEMITTGALLHGDRERLLAFDPAEHPVAVQLGGSDPAALAACARICEAWGYDEINLNLGCPSDRVQSGRFGACLMAEPALVADCIGAMTGAVGIPVTLKTRIGIDHLDSYAVLAGLVEQVAAAGCTSFIVHARKAWLRGLSPKENRDIPPLQYDRVYRLKQDFPSLEIVINGGIRTLDQAEEHLKQVDGVMMGREVYHNPWILAQADRRFYGDGHPVPSRHEVLEQLLPFVERELEQGVRLHRISRHILGLFQGRPGARAWRRYLSEHAHLEGAGPGVIRRAAALVPS
ncbi:MAG TPA: tRNA dihydrouridine(20/20a) synthase DusA [Sedimenticola sp.]|nr:tRNA dihydrouridine(20/20a) synthase DusA [Sedimenticola sp.]